MGQVVVSQLPGGKSFDGLGVPEPTREGLDEQSDRAPAAGGVRRDVHVVRAGRPAAFTTAGARTGALYLSAA
jgi:hypothetical protein